ncbi:MAG: RHS repeat-associated core domain-containing protein [Fimbriimonadaceae bacterium]
MTSFGSLLSAVSNGAGLRAWKDSGGNRTYYLYDGDQPVIELDGAGSVIRVNTFGAWGLVSSRSSGATTLYTYDYRGNTVERLNSAGAILSHHTYDAYGVMTSNISTSDPWAGMGAQSGYYRDSETGLSLCTRRYYDPAGGRFLTRDPIGHAGGLNLYEYCGGNPINRLDADGLMWDPLTASEAASANARMRGGKNSEARATLNDIGTALLNFIGGDEVRQFSAVSGCYSGEGNYFMAGLYGVGTVAVITGSAFSFSRFGGGADVKKLNYEYSHWIPSRYGRSLQRKLAGTKYADYGRLIRKSIDKKSWWNGRYVSAWEHIKTDTYRGKRALTWNQARAHLNRLPNWARGVVFSFANDRLQ